MHCSVVESASQTAISGSQRFFVWDIKSRPHLADHNTGISLLLSTIAWVLLSPPIECQKTRPTAFKKRPYPWTVWRKKVPAILTLSQATDWTWLAVRDLITCANLAHSVAVHNKSVSPHPPTGRVVQVQLISQALKLFDRLLPLFCVGKTAAWSVSSALGSSC